MSPDRSVVKSGNSHAGVLLNRYEKFRQSAMHSPAVAVVALLDEYATKRTATRNYCKYFIFEDADRRTMFLPENPPRTAGKFPWFDCTEDVIEFFANFGGLRESPPDHSGSFAGGDRRFKMASILKPLYGSKDFGTHNTIKDHPVLFEAANGDVAAMGSDASVYWFSVSERDFKQRYASFDEFVSAFVDLRRNTMRPFDAYSGL